MRPTRTFAAASALALALAAAPTAAARSELLGPAPAAASLTLVLPLNADLAGLRRFALAVTTPGSPLYQRYVPLTQLANRFGASPATKRRVLTFLRRSGARRVNIDPTGLFADAVLSTGLAQRLFATPLGQFRNGRGERFTAPAKPVAVRVPAALRGAVSGVVGLDTRPVFSASEATRLRRERPVARASSQPTSARPRTGATSGCAAGVGAGGFTPNQYLTAYGYDPLHFAGVGGQGERVALIEIDGFRYSDIQRFARCFGLPIPRLRGFGVGVSGPLPPGGEATLDLETLDAAAPRLRSVDVYETLARAADTLQALTSPLRARAKPQVISASLGLCEPAVFRAVGAAGINATEGALQMAAASGITFVAASGDQGSADCTGSNGAPIPALAVNYPASSWWVTGVGGTNLMLDGSNQITQQVVWNDAAVQPGSAGGGGLSALFRRPDYQRGSVAQDARGVPDISMLSDVAPGYSIYCSARPDCINSGNSDPWQTVGGTSAATPLLAGGFALADQELRLHGRRDLGLVNPLLYAIGRSRFAGEIFYDVRSIGNDVGPDIGSGPLGCCTAGPGYDEASGFGSLKLTNFATVALGAESQIIRVGVSLPHHQRPVHSRGIRARVSCSGACQVAAVALVRIGHARRFEVDSRPFQLHSKGFKIVTARFSRRQLSRLRSALARHKRIVATVYGVLFDPIVSSVLFIPSLSIEKRTAPKRLAISR